MGIAGSIVDQDFFEDYLGMRVEAIDLTELHRRIRDEIYDADEYEMALECTYEFHPTDWLTLQPDVQWIRNPGMDPGLDDAVALSLRAYISF